MDVIITFLFYFLIFAVIHSLLAADHTKTKAERLLKSRFRFYRMAYTVISFFTFAPAFLAWLKYTSFTPLVYIVPYWLYPVFLLIRLAAIGLFAYASFQTDVLEFIGIKQIQRKTRETILMTGGAYGIVRHPLYTGAIIILFTTMEMSRLDLTAAVLASVYFIIGAFIEERRLLSVFGEEYRKYQQQVSMFIPVKWLRKKIS